MIDTLKMITHITPKVYEVISKRSNVKTSYSRESGQVFYEIISTSLEGSYSSSLSVRVEDSGRYGMNPHVKYLIVVEGSFHKLIRGQNAYDGFWDVQEVAKGLIELVENAYNIKLPTVRHWFLQRIDITNCYDLWSNKAVRRYINNLSKCNYPRRKLRFFDDESIYLSGKSTTLKIYNKLLEFQKNDLQKMRKNNFDHISYMNDIQGFVRFECEIKKKRLVDYYNGLKLIRVSKVNYSDMESIWRNEFMKLLKLFDNDIKIVRGRDAVQKRLVEKYGESSGGDLFNFYLLLIMEGQKTIKNRISKTTYYRKLNLLKQANVDFTQSDIKIDFEEDKIVDFDPFNYPKVV